MRAPHLITIKCNHNKMQLDCGSMTRKTIFGGCERAHNKAMHTKKHTFDITTDNALGHRQKRGGMPQVKQTWE
jgi:hypothetical protein